MIAELTLEHKAIAVALAEYLKEEGYLLSLGEKEELEKYRLMDDEWVNGIVAAKMIGCSPAQVIKLRKRGAIKYKTEGSVPRYSVRSIKAYNNSRIVK